MEIGIIGGTGKQGYGLAKRLSQLDYSVRIGSREDSKGKNKADSLGGSVTGGTNEYASKAEIIILAIPADQIVTLLEPLKANFENKIIIDSINNLSFGKTIKAPQYNGLSVYEFLMDFFPNSKIVTAFKTISSVLLEADDPLDQSDFLITTDDESFRAVSEISEKLGLFPVRITSAYHGETLERMVALSIQINKYYKKSHSGFIVKM